MTRLIQRAFVLAKHELGVHETGLNNPRIVEYHKCTDLEESMQEEGVSWCSSFVNFCIQKCVDGGKGTRNAMARSWLAWGRKINAPEEGCIVIFRRGNNGFSGHVGFFVGYSENRTMLKILGGNQDDKVCIKEYSTSRVLGYRTSKD